MQVRIEPNGIAIVSLPHDCLRGQHSDVPTLGLHNQWMTKIAPRMFIELINGNGLNTDEDDLASLLRDE